MNYDKAHDLAKSIRESEEYKKLMEAQKKLEGDETALKMVKDFLMQQVQFQYAEMAGGEEAEKMKEKMQELALLVNANEVARDYLQAHMVYNKCCEDVYRIVMEVITEGMKILEQ